MASKQTIPQFSSLEEESDFWDSHSATDFEAEEVAASEVVAALKQRPDKRRVTLSLDPELFARLQALAAQRHLPTSAVVRELLWQGVQKQGNA